MFGKDGLIAQVSEQNQLRNPNLIYPGQTLTLPHPRPRESSLENLGAPDLSVGSQEHSGRVDGLELAPESGVSLRERMMARQTPSDNLLDIRDGGPSSWLHQAQNRFIKLKRRLGLSETPKPADIEIVPTDKDFERILNQS